MRLNHFKLRVAVDIPDFAVALLGTCPELVLNCHLTYLLLSNVLTPQRTLRMTNGPAADKDEIMDEWKEGPHKVIERSSGPGEDVSP